MTTTCPRSAFFLAAALLAWCASAALTAHAQPRQHTEYQVKAAFLYNFAKFAEWPADAFAGPSAPFIFGILGDDPFGKDIDIVKKRTVGSRPVQVRRYDDVREIRTCHILFISSSETERLDAVLNALRTRSILLVSDMDRFAERGGMISLVIRDDNVGFKINLDAVTRTGITIHSRLLNMAIIVHDEMQGAGQ